MRSVLLYTLALVVIVMEADSEITSGGSSLLDSSADLGTSPPRHRLDKGIPSRTHHARMLGQPVTSTYVADKTNIKPNPTRLVVGDYVLLKAVIENEDSYTKLSIGGNNMTLQDGVARATTFRIATPHPAHDSTGLNLQAAICLVSNDLDILHKGNSSNTTVPGVCEADLAIVFQSAAGGPSAPGLIQPSGGAVMLKSRSSNSYLQWLPDSSSLDWSSGPVISLGQQVHWKLEVINQDCVVEGWVAQGQCDAQCGSGTQPMARAVDRQPGPVGAACPELRKQVPCSAAPCPVDCEVSPWSAFGPCPVECGGGIQSRSRVVLGPAEHGGADCPVLTSTSQCNAMPCPINCMMGEWSNPSECSNVCNSGIKLKSRVVLTEALYGGTPCGSLVSASACNEQACKVDCEVSPWAGWTKCSRSCGGGQQSRSRDIVTAAATGGSPCGRLKEKRVCNDDIVCPGDCVVTEWSPYSTCTEICGGGNSIRTRTVVRKPKSGGLGCPVLDESISCNSQLCDQNCELTVWTEWTDCSRNCGCGSKTRERHIIVQPSGGAKCGNVLEQEDCNRHACGCSYNAPRAGYTLTGELSSEAQEFMTLDTAKRYCDGEEECGGVVMLTPTHFEVRSGAALQMTNNTDLVAHVKMQCAGPGGITCGLHLWLKAEDISTVIDGGRVESWYDASGNGHDAMQDTPELRPTWDKNVMLGRPGVVFNGRQNTLYGSAVTGESKTMFAVVATLEDIDPASAVGQSAVFVTDSDDGLLVSRTVNHTFLKLGAARSAAPVEGWTDVRNAFTVVTMLFEPDTASLLIKSGSPQQRCLEGVLPASGTASERYSIGSHFGSNWFFGAIGELLIYDRVLTHTEQQTVESQLQVKWLPTILPPVVLWLRFEDPLSLGGDSSTNQAMLHAQNLDQVEGHLEGFAISLQDSMAMLQWPGDGAQMDTSYTMTMWTITPFPDTGNPHSLISGATRIIVNAEQTAIGVATTSIEGDLLLDSGFDWSSLSPGWHHLVVVAEPATELTLESTSFYVDGSYVGSSEWHMPNFDTFGNIAGGEEAWGVVDDVKFFASRVSDLHIREMATVSCSVNSWGDYGPCSKTCGEGQQQRFRTIEQNPQNAGAECPPLSESRTCGEPCTVHCVMSAWTEYSPCSKECGGGTQSQSRSVVIQPSNGGRQCPDGGRLRTCSTNPCPVNCKLFGWQSFGTCSRTCGGLQKRSRSIEVAGDHGGGTCPHTEEDSLCNTAPCEHTDWSFETGTLDGWQLTGSAFEFQPTRADNPVRRNASQQTGVVGHFWVSTFEKFQGQAGEIPGTIQGEKPVGTLLSPEFKVKSSSISFLIGGGSDNNTEYVELVINGEGVRRATGLDCDVLHRERWNVSEYVGQLAHLKVVDDSSDTWGHIAVDDFLFDNACWVHQKQCNAHQDPGLIGSFQWSGDEVSSEGKCLALADQLHEYCHNEPDEPTSVESRNSGTWRRSTTQCQVSHWTQYSECSQQCGGGNQTRSRAVKVKPSKGAASCPFLNQTLTCNLEPCEYSRYPTMAMAPLVVENGWSNMTAEQCMGFCDASDSCFGFTRNIETDDSVEDECFPHTEEQLETCSDDADTISWVRSGIPHSCSTIQLFSQTGEPVEARIPPKASTCSIKLWGAGGGDGCNGGKYGGGGGAFVEGTLKVSPREVLTVLIGQGGAAAAGEEAPQRAFGGGGGWTNECTDCSDGVSSARCAETGGGGGRTALMRGSEVLAVAAGGGGAGDGAGGGGGGGDHGGVIGGASHKGPGGAGGTEMSAGDPNGFDHTGGDAVATRAGGGGGGLFGGGGGTAGGGGGGGSSSAVALSQPTAVLWAGRSGSKGVSGVSGGVNDTDYPSAAAPTGLIGAAGGGTWASGTFRGGDGYATLRCQSSPFETAADISGAIKLIKSPGVPGGGTLGYWDGDWLLLFNYAQSGNNGKEPLRSGLLPQSLTARSHAFVADALPGLTAAHVAAAKFYCQSSRHDRVVHFENNKTEITEMLFSGGAAVNQPEWWSEKASTVYHSDHTASLPASADSAGQLTANPFFARSEKEWRTSPGLWRCDDLASGKDGGHTIHRMWVKFTADAPIERHQPSTAAADSDVTEQLLARWPLDSRWGWWARDSTGNGNRARVFSNSSNASSAWLDQDRALNAVEGWASAAPSRSLSAIANGATLSAWIRLAAGDPQSREQNILTQQIEGGNGFALTAHNRSISFSIQSDAGQIVLNAPISVSKRDQDGVKCEDKRSTSVCIRLQKTGNCNKRRPKMNCAKTCGECGGDGWTMVAVTFNENTTRLFINETLIQEKPGAVLPDNVVKQSQFQIGATTRDKLKCCAFAGEIKDVRVYRTALSIEEVAALVTEDATDAEVAPLDDKQGETRVFEEAVTWYEAARECKKWGGHLLKISNETSSSSWGDRLGSHFWLGLSLQDTSSEKPTTGNLSSSWQWSDGSLTTRFSKWVGGSEPQNSDLECAAAVPYEWTAMKCHELLPFVCERDGNRQASSWKSLSGTCGPSAVLVDANGRAETTQCVKSGVATEESCLKAAREACSERPDCGAFTFSLDWSIKAPAQDGDSTGRVLLCAQEIQLEPSDHWRSWVRRSDQLRVSKVERRERMIGESEEGPSWLRVATEGPGSQDLLKQLSVHLPDEQTTMVQAGDREGVCGASLGGHYTMVKLEWTEGIEQFSATFLPERDIFRDETDKTIPLVRFETDHPRLSNWMHESGGAIFCLARGGTDTVWAIKPASDIEDTEGCSGDAWEGRGLFYPGSAHSGGFTGVKASGESKAGLGSAGVQIFVRKSPKIDLELEGWELVRRTVEGWYQSADELVGTERYGVAGSANEDNEFSVRFVDREYDQVLLASGDLEHWVITTARQLQTHGALVDAAVIASSLLNRPHRIKWAHRTGDPRAPIVTLTDYEAGTSKDILYAGGRASSLSKHTLQAHKGANVFIRKKQDCAVYGWSAYGQCSRQCGGRQKRTRTVRLPLLAGGASCPALEEVVPCNLPPWLPAHGCGPVPTLTVAFEEMPACTGSCPRMVPRDSGMAMEFGDSQSLQLGDCTTTGLCASKKGFTIMMWIKLDVSGRAKESLLSIGDQLEIAIQTQVPTIKLGGESYQAAAGIKDDAWSHVVFRYNRQTGGMSVFVDGVAEEEFGKKMVWFDDDGLVDMGLNAAGVSLFGEVADFVIFDTPVDDAIVKAQAAGPRPDITEVDISKGESWMTARDACAPRDLCSSIELCDGLQPTYLRNSSWAESVWLPVADGGNMWLQYGTSQSELPNVCKSWQDVEGGASGPSWGNTRVSNDFKHIALCCL